MTTLKIVSLQYTDTQTVINFNSFDDSSDQGQPSIGAWTVPGEMTGDQALAYAKSMVEPDVTVSLNLV